MLKLLTVIALFIIGGVWTAGLSCDSCGNECTPACGTRRFRICCFNHLKRKRTEVHQFEDDLEDEKDFPMEHAVLVIQKPEWLKKLSIIQAIMGDPNWTDDIKKLTSPLK